MKFGLLGYGSIGRRHAENLLKLGHQLVMYDPAQQAGTLHALAFKYERELYDSDVDAVIIASPTMFHEQAIRACVERRKPMLVEKPIAAQVGSLPLLLQMADEHNVPVMMGNNLRFHSVVKRTKSWLQNERYGAENWATFTCAVEPTATAHRDGTLLNVGAHEVDLAIHLLGPAKFICGVHDQYRADFVLEHDGGVRSTFHLDNISANRVRKFCIGCDNRSIGADLDGRCFESNGVYGRMNLWGNWDDDYKAEMEAFVNLVKGVPTACAATGHDGLKTLELLMQIGHCK